MKKGSIVSKIKEKIDTKCLNLINKTFWWKNWPHLGPGIFGTKCDRDKPFCLAERGGQSDPEKV